LVRFALSPGGPRAIIERPQCRTAVALEQRFGLEIGDDEVTGDLFETLGSLAAFIEAKRA